jgi:hypothetical protein
MELYKKLDIQLQKHSAVDKINIRIITDNGKSELVKLTQKEYKDAQISTLVDDFDPADIIIIIYDERIVQYDANIIKFMNEYIKRKKLFILIVPLEFDFNHIVENVKANSIDAISWHKDNKKYKDYIIVVRKD